MNRSTSGRRPWCSIFRLHIPLILSVFAFGGTPLAQAWQDAADSTATEPAAATEAAATEPAATTEAAAPETAAPTLPPYMSPTVDGEKPAWPDAAGANAGYWITPSAGPVGDGDPTALTNGQLYDRIAHNMFSINMLWVLIAGALVMFMQLGFMMVETGLCRAKNSSHTAAMNLMVYPLG